MEEYLARIERHFGLRRGGRLLLSPRDWQQVEEWHERGLPLPVVLRGINRAFDRFHASRRSDRINSLSYCAQHVEEAWEQERERAAMEGGAAREDDRVLEGPVEHLRRVAKRCRAEAESRDGDFRERLVAAAVRLGELAEGLADDELGAREVDARAIELEAELRDADPELFESRDPDRPSEGLPGFSPWSL